MYGYKCAYAPKKFQYLETIPEYDKSGEGGERVEKTAEAIEKPACECHADGGLDGPPDPGGGESGP